MQRIEQINWSGGIDNLSRNERVKEGCVRDALNVTPTNGGTFTLRPGAERIVPGNRIRGLLALGDDLLYADNTQLMVMNARDNVPRLLASIDPVGGLVGAIHNDELFISTDSQCWRYRNGQLRPWGVAEPSFLVEIVPNGGSLTPGVYRIACTQTNAQGEESGVREPAIVTLSAGSGLRITCIPDHDHTAQVYLSFANSQTLYRQSAVAGEAMIRTVRDDTARLENEGEGMPLPSRLLASLGASVVGASGGLLWLSQPMRVHRRSLTDRFFQYPRAIGLLLKAGSGLFVSADKTYFLQSPEDEQPLQREVLPYPAVSGSGVNLADGRVAWMTPYGLAIGSADGSVSLISQDRFAPALSEGACSGALSLDGNQVVVTAMQGPREQTGMVARDYYEVEVL